MLKIFAPALMLMTFSLTSVAAPASAQGNQAAPKTITVRIDADGTKTVFKAASVEGCTAQNQLQAPASKNELDEETSSAAWRCGGSYWTYYPAYGYGYGYSYAYPVYYYPTYTYYYGPYSYVVYDQYYPYGW